MAKNKNKSSSADIELEDKEKEKLTPEQKMVLAIALINKTHGSGTVLDIRKVDKTIRRISTGIIGLDEALGGGWPVGRLVELYGNQGAGKTTTIIEAIVQFQKNDPRPVVLVDAENKINFDYAEKMGVDFQRIIPSQTSCVEEIADLIEQLSPIGVSAIFIDSLAALSSRVELEGDLSDANRNTTGQRIMMIGAMMKRAAQIANKYNTMILYTNQIRINQSGYGALEMTPNGKAPGYYAAIRINLSKVSKDGKVLVGGENSAEIGHRVAYYLEKNQTAMPHKTAEVNLIWGKGIDKIDSLIETALNNDVLKKGGAWYYYEEQKFQGRKAFISFLEENKDIFNLIYAQTLEAIDKLGSW